jgi:hypothetical protein
VLALFRDGTHGDPAAGAFLRRLNIPGWLGRDTAETVLSFQDGVPALVRCRPPLPLYVWNLDVSSEGGNWVKQPVFLPFFAELLMSHRRGADTGSDSVCGTVLQYTRPPASDACRVGLVAKESLIETVPGVHAAPDLRSYATDPVEEPGVYGWTCDDQVASLAVVNFPSAESDLRTLDPARVAADVASVVESGHRVRRLRDGIDLWPWLLMAAALAAAIEGVSLWWMEGRG